MSQTIARSWQNETALTPHPLETTTGFDSLLVDANFVQFDNFVPTLHAIFADNDKISFEITFDTGLQTIEVEKSSLTGVPYTVVMRDGDRYLGKLVLGAEALSMYDDLASRRLTIESKFLAYLVKSIPSNCGVYSFSGMTGAVQLTSDLHIYYQVAGQNVTFNAVKVPAATNENYLKTLNTVEPVQNSVYLEDSEIIKITPTGASVINFSLVGTGVANLLIDQNNTIPTIPRE